MKTDYYWIKKNETFGFIEYEIFVRTAKNQPYTWYATTPDYRNAQRFVKEAKNWGEKLS